MTDVEGICNNFVVTAVLVVKSSADTASVGVRHCFARRDAHQYPLTFCGKPAVCRGSSSNSQLIKPPGLKP